MRVSDGEYKKVHTIEDATVAWLDPATKDPHFALLEGRLLGTWVGLKEGANQIGFGRF